MAAKPAAFAILGWSCRATRGAGHDQLAANAPGALLMNALTIDVEDYFHVSAFARHIARSNGTACPAVWNATLILFSTCWTSTVRTPPFHPELGRATLSNLIRRIVAQGLNWRAMAMRINVPNEQAAEFATSA
jgi:hypothetical protein